MLDKRFTNRMANFWSKFIADPRATYAVLQEDRLMNQMEKAGFVMDMGESFKRAYPNLAFLDTDELKQSLPRVTNAQVLANLIFTQWRYWTHWAYSPADVDLNWFILAFKRLEELTR